MGSVSCRSSANINMFWDSVVAMAVCMPSLYTPKMVFCSPSPCLLIPELFSLLFSVFSTLGRNAIYVLCRSEHSAVTSQHLLQPGFYIHHSSVGTEISLITVENADCLWIWTNTFLTMYVDNTFIFPLRPSDLSHNVLLSEFVVPDMVSLLWSEHSKLLTLPIPFLPQINFQHYES